MTGAPQTRPNPYVGPRAFQYGETLYGRDREVMDLLDLLIAERIVLLYSPSGAGKTSLIQAALIPKLEQEGFQILPVMRVSLEPPTVGQVGHSSNRYVLSLLLSLEEPLPAGQQTPLAELAGMELGDYLDRRPAAADEVEAEVLIFDQFEEILTVEPTNQEAKAAFFAQVGATLRDRRRWALFAMREEYLAGLDPYLRPLPTRLSTTYRLELLGKEAALDAIEKPARQAGVDFTAAAASKLVDDLRQVWVQRPDGTPEERLGLYVEPVQLQVVCRRLWEKLPTDATQIVEADVEAVGDVDSALAGYYAEQVAAIAGGTGVRERTIREWFDRHLITEQGIRGQVLQGPERSEGLDNRAIWPLMDAHLLRAEKRRGATWFELAHDRLIEPVRADNATWREAHLSALQRQAALWESQGRPGGLLLRDQALVEAEEWAADHDDELTDVERDFLEECRETRAIAERERQSQRNRRLATIATVISAVVILAFLVSLKFFFQAREEAKIAEARRLEAVTAQAQAKDEAERARQAEATAKIASTAAIEQKAAAEIASTKAVEQQKRAEAAWAEAVIERDYAKAEVTAAAEARADLVAHLEAQLTAVAEATRTPTPVPVVATPTPTTTPRGSPIPHPTPTSTATPTITPTPTPNQAATATVEAIQTRLAQVGATQTAVAPPPDRIVFASNRLSSTDLYSMKTDGSDLTRLTFNVAFDASYSPGADKIVCATKRNDRAWLFILSPDGKEELIGGQEEDWDPAISPDGQRVAFVSSRHSLGGEIYLMNIDGSDVKRLTHDPAKDWGPAWSPDGQRITFVSEREGQADIWLMDADGGNLVRLTFNDAQDVYPAWSPDGRQIAFGSDRDGNVEIYTMDVDGRNQYNLTNSPFDENYPAWSPDGNWLAFSRFTTNNEIFLMKIDGDRPVQLTNHPAMDLAPIWLP